MKKKKICGGNLFWLCLCVLFLIVGILLKIQSIYIVNEWTEITATIIGYKKEEKKFEDKITYYPQYEYEVDGKNCFGHGAGSSFTPYDVGDMINIRYNPADVCHSSAEGLFDFGLFVIMVSSTVLVLLIGKFFLKEKIGMLLSSIMIIIFGIILGIELANLSILIAILLQAFTVAGAYGLVQWHKKYYKKEKIA